MSNEKLEALMWRAENSFVSYRAGANATATYNQSTAEIISVAVNNDLRAARALGVEEGKREERLSWSIASEALGALCDATGIARGGYPSFAMQQATKRLLAQEAEIERLREAAPVDDGRRWEIYVGTVPASSHPGSRTAAEAMRILWDMNTHPVFSMQVYGARLVEPKRWAVRVNRDQAPCSHHATEQEARVAAEWLRAGVTVEEVKA